MNASVNSRIGVHVLRTNRALTVLVSLQPFSTNYSNRQCGLQLWVSCTVVRRCCDCIASSAPATNVHLNKCPTQLNLNILVYTFVFPVASFHVDKVEMTHAHSF